MSHNCINNVDIFTNSDVSIWRKYESAINMSPPKLSITIVHHHGLEMVHDCLKSIYEHAPDFPFEIIVVDNASTDGAVSMIEQNFPQVILLKNEKRYGFGHNQNQAMRTAQGDYILLYNDDTLVHGAALSKLCYFLDSHPDVGLVGPRLLNSDGSLQMSCYKFPSPMRSIFENLLLTAAFPDNKFVGDYRRWNHDSAREVDFVIGAAMLIRREIIDQVGLFDELFFMYSEETDWQMRIHNAGWKIMLCPEAEITHLGGGSTEQIKDRQFVEFQKSSLKLLRKHYGIAGSVLQRSAMICGAVLRIILWSTISLINPKKKQRAHVEISTWARLLKWWLGLGPYVGLSPD